MYREHLPAVMGAVCAAVGVALPENLKVHLLRHVCNARWENNGIEKSQRMLALGHQNADVQGVYSHADRATLCAAFRSKPRLN